MMDSSNKQGEEKYEELTTFLRKETEELKTTVEIQKIHLSEIEAKKLQQQQKKHHQQRGHT